MYEGIEHKGLLLLLVLLLRNKFMVLMFGKLLINERDTEIK